MNTSNISGNEYRRPTVTALRPARRMQLGILGATLMAFSMSAQAQEQEFTQPDSIDTPWNVLSTAPFLVDPTFNQGLYAADAFAGSFSENHYGRKVVRLSNGDVIVAGVVPSSSGGGRTAINLGLLKYNSAGQRVAWTNPGEYGFFANNYVIFPNSGDPTNSQNIKDVLDIKLLGNRIFVLVDHRFGGTEDIDSQVHVFGVDGAFIRSVSVFSSGSGEYSGGMAFRSSLTLPETITIGVVASTFNVVWRPTFRSGTVNADSSITFDATVFPNPGNYCPANRGCILRDIAAGGRNANGASTKFYLAGTRQTDIPDNSDWDFLAMAVNFDGSPVTSFGGAGVTTVPFFEGGNNFDDANSMQVNTTGVLATAHDEIYVSGFVSRQCKDGFGIAKLKDDGSLDNTFGKVVGGGRSGKMVVGGAVPPINGICSDLPQFSTSNTYANESILANGKLVLAGFTSKFNPPICIGGQPCHEEDVDATIAVVDTAQGDIDSFRTYPYSDTINGPRTRHSGFGGVVDSGNGTFTAVGDVRFFQTAAGQPAGANQFATLRIRSDGIFANGFE